MRKGVVEEGKQDEDWGCGGRERRSSEVEKDEKGGHGGLSWKSHDGAAHGVLGTEEKGKAKN